MLTGRGGGEFMCLIIVRFVVRERVRRVELDGSHLGGFCYHTRCGNILRMRKENWSRCNEEQKVL
jgi:hypothetical protein